MPHDHHPRTTGLEPADDRRPRPRVVILNPGDAARVEVLDLPGDAAPGASFRHCGTRWRVTSSRPRTRVLIAEPIDA